MAQNRVVIVTGAGTGMGAAVARRFARDGATVVAVGRRKEKLDEVAATPGIVAHPADVSDLDAVTRLVDRVVGEWGRVDVLVNSAGVPALGSVETITQKTWRTAFAVNVDGIFHTCRAAMPHLRDSRGCVVNIGSVSAFGGDAGLVAYNTAKAAVANLTRAMAVDHAPEVRVNAVHPGLILHTEITAVMDEYPQLAEAFNDRIPFGRGGDPDEIASVVAFLASPEASYITGAQLPVDGGLSAISGQPRLAP